MYLISRWFERRRTTGRKGSLAVILPQTSRLAASSQNQPFSYRATPHDLHDGLVQPPPGNLPQLGHFQAISPNPTYPTSPAIAIAMANVRLMPKTDPRSVQFE